MFIRDDAIEISSVLWPVRVLGDMEYYFRARETTMEVSPDPSRRTKLSWIIIKGMRDGRNPMLAIRARREYQLPEVWNALVAVGAVPIGPPPPPGYPS